MTVTICRINTMFDGLILALYLLITIAKDFFCERNCIFYGGRLMLSVNILCTSQMCECKN